MGSGLRHVAAVTATPSKEDTVENYTTVYSTSDRESVADLKSRQGEVCLWVDHFWKLLSVRESDLLCVVERIGRAHQEASRHLGKHLVHAFTLRDSHGTLGHAEWLAPITSKWVCKDRYHSSLRGRQHDRELTIHSIAQDGDGITTVFYSWNDEYEVMLNRISLSRFLKEARHGWIRPASDGTEVTIEITR